MTIGRRKDYPLCPQIINIMKINFVLEVKCKMKQLAQSALIESTYVMTLKIMNHWENYKLR